MRGPIPGARLRPAIWGTALISLVLIVGMVLVRSLGSASSGRTYVVFLVNVILVVSIQAFIGNSGVVSFGHVAFMGIGAYTTAYLTTAHGLSPALTEMLFGSRSELGQQELPTDLAERLQVG